MFWRTTSQEAAPALGFGETGADLTTGEALVAGDAAADGVDSRAFFLGAIVYCVENNCLLNGDCGG